MKEPREVLPTYRVLTEPIYDLDFWIIRLTWVDAILCFSGIVLFWIIFEIIGIGRFTLGGFGLDPAFGGLIVGVLLALAISALHWVRPEGSIEVVLLGLKEPTFYRGRTPDRKWKPSLPPHFRKSDNFRK